MKRKSGAGNCDAPKYQSIATTLFSMRKTYTKVQARVAHDGGPENEMEKKKKEKETSRDAVRIFKAICVTIAVIGIRNPLN